MCRYTLFISKMMIHLKKNEGNDLRLFSKAERKELLTQQNTYQFVTYSTVPWPRKTKILTTTLLLLSNLFGLTASVISYLDFLLMDT